MPQEQDVHSFANGFPIKSDGIATEGGGVGILGCTTRTRERALSSCSILNNPQQSDSQCPAKQANAIVLNKSKETPIRVKTSTITVMQENR